MTEDKSNDERDNFQGIHKVQLHSIRHEGESVDQHEPSHYELLHQDAHVRSHGLYQPHYDHE